MCPLLGCGTTLCVNDMFSICNSYTKSFILISLIVKPYIKLHLKVLEDRYESHHKKFFKLFLKGHNVIQHLLQHDKLEMHNFILSCWFSELLPMLDPLLLIKSSYTSISISSFESCANVLLLFTSLFHVLSMHIFASLQLLRHQPEIICTPFFTKP